MGGGAHGKNRAGNRPSRMKSALTRAWNHQPVVFGLHEGISCRHIQLKQPDNAGQNMYVVVTRHGGGTPPPGEDRPNFGKPTLSGTALTLSWRRRQLQEAASHRAVDRRGATRRCRHGAATGPRVLSRQAIRLLDSRRRPGRSAQSFLEPVRNPTESPRGGRAPVFSGMP